MTFKTRLKLAAWRVADHLRHSKYLRSLNALRLYLQALFHGTEQEADLLCKALGFCEWAPLNHLICRRLDLLMTHQEFKEVWYAVVKSTPKYQKLIDCSSLLTRSIVLKAPGSGGEKGVLLVHFEYNWARLALGLSDSEFEWLDQNYDLLLSTSWSPTDYAALALILVKTSGPVFVMPCNHGDILKLRLFHPRVVALETMPCDWIDPQHYQPKSSDQRPIDFLMVANWGEFKRHRDFFIALRALPADMMVVLVGQKEGGRGMEFIKKQAQEIGVPQSLQIHQSLPIDQVAALQMQSKVSVIFSRREGCCVAAVESLIAGCALGMRTDAHVGPLAYINERTGLRLRPGYLAEDLLRLHEMSDRLDPAVWAGANVSCQITHARVNAVLRDSTLARCLPWSRDMALHHWRPFPRHSRQEDAAELEPVYAELHRRFPKVFPDDLIIASAS